MVEVSSSSVCAHDSFLSLFIQHINGLESGFDKVSLIYTLSFMIYSALTSWFFWEWIKILITHS